ncbi:hypothetical protein Snoj_44080 [Streptomyces nojiriensis]|uniref:Uncharacterized protein n=1 Tax=Streptomyces nojiriensis TaxID=66374 RepID=A0ABQ3SQR5_9ACTN|nr:hypothetical protein GCM10010205_12740 [Streptomyces nojiriensis]GHI70490.1 hypothetical protein Snoj_44080 [Streptomyces nojiriensis]
MAHALDAIESCGQSVRIADVTAEDLGYRQFWQGGIGRPMREDYGVVACFDKPSYNRVAYESVGSGHKYAH